MNFEFDKAIFRYDSVSNFIELYYLIDASVLVQKKDSARIFSQAILNFNIYDPIKNDTLVYKNYKYEKEIDTTENTPDNNQLGIVAYVLPRGDYKLEVTIMDVNSPDNYEKLTQSIIIEPYGKVKQKISDIELAFNIEEVNDQKNTLFYKNSYEVTPNPSTLFSEKSPVMFYYSEIYNLDPNLDSSYYLNKKIFNSRGQEIFNQSKNLKTSSKSIVDVGLLTLKTYPTDTYTLNLEVTNSLSREVSTASKKFFLYNPGVKDTLNLRKQSGTYIQSEYAVMSEEDCNLLFEESKYISTDTEIDEYESLKTPDTKREYLYNYWLKRDSEPATVINEYKNDYMKRVDFTNKNFGNFNSPGYKSEKGRIYLTYGPPDDIERYPNEKNLKPYEIWTYQSIEGGVYFVFADVLGFSKYQLLHSTKNGEIKDMEWQRRIKTE
jgi:GWxTD domain-containing protein